VDWSFLINEVAVDLVVTTFDTAPLAIMVLGMVSCFVIFVSYSLLMILVTAVWNLGVYIDANISMRTL